MTPPYAPLQTTPDLLALRPLDVFACPLDGVINIEASAGTGKTWNICWLYLRLLLEKRRPPKEILVVTFTEAATAELRERIRGRLMDVLHALQNPRAAVDPFVMQFLKSCVDQAPQPAPGVAALTRELAENLIEAALLGFDEAAIFTIHGFCHRALAESAFAAGLPFDNEVAADGRDFTGQAARDFWRREILPLGDAAGLDPEGMAKCLDEVVSRPLATLLWPPAVAGIERNELLAAMTAARQALEVHADAAVPLLKTAVASSRLSKHFAKEPAEIDTAADAWRTALAQDEPSLEAVEAGQRLTTSYILEKGTKKDIAVPQHPLFDVLDHCQELLRQQQAAKDYRRFALLQQFIATAPGTLQQAKRTARIITFDDMLHRLYAALVADANSNGALAQNLRQRFPCALIDEFQDTDPLQLAIFTAIYDTRGPLFLVGDPKQAIYSFRGADLNAYLSARNAASERYSLDANQRSSAPMISAVNALFSGNAVPFRLPGLEFASARKGDKPGLPFTDDSGAPRAALSVWHLRAGSKEDPLLKPEVQRRVIAACVAEVVRLINAGRQGSMRIGARPLEPRDIALLVRTNAQGRLLKQSLEGAGVNAVELSQANVFASFEAREMQRVLAAIAASADRRLLLGALATVMLGNDAAAVARIAADETLLDDCAMRFRGYRESWQQHGFGRMWRELLSREKIIERLLPLPGGERRATNLAHLAELLSAQARRRPGIEPQLQWLAAQRRNPDNNEGQQQRLESDQNLVQIVTKHRSKGLEYPIVFCPFVWDDGRLRRGGYAERYFDAEHGGTVLDFRGQKSAALARERAEERLRLLYVALTRAVHRCYIAGGSYYVAAGRGVSSKPCAGSALNWLVSGNGISTEVWDEGKTPLTTIDAQWDALAARADGSITLLPLAESAPASVIAAPDAAPQFAACQLTRPLPVAPWRLESYSSLLRRQGGEFALADHDAVPPAPTFPRTVPEWVAADDILRFPRGARAGECLHAVFEHVDFSHPAGWTAAAERSLQHHADVGAGSGSTSGSEDKYEPERGRLVNMLADVAATPLPGGWLLGEINPQQRLAELEFYFPVDRLRLAQVFDLLESHGWSGQRVDVGRLHGYLRGSIDFVCRHGERWYLIDWKSNHLGYRPEDYAPERIAAEMREAHYDLQALIYLVALHRYLRLRLGERYRPADHLGGALYLFVRGVRPQWPGKGVWHWCPAVALIDELDALFGESITETDASQESPA